MALGLGLHGGLRLNRGSETSLIVYDDWKPIMEWGGPTQWVAWNAYGPGADEILWRSEVGIGYLRYHHDRHGSVTALLGVWGDVKETYSYDAFGQPTITDSNGNIVNWHWSIGSAVGNRFMFQGREYLSEIAAMDFRNRFYDPWMGRFLQVDPIGFDAGDMNLFRFCGDDPVNKTDPFGLVPPGDGLIDLRRDTLKDMYDANRKNVNDSTSKPDRDAYGHPTKQEFRRDGYRTSDGKLHQTEPVKGERRAGAPSARDPGNPFGKDAKREYITHSHVTGNGSHYGRDVPSANRAGAVSGVGTILDGGRKRKREKGSKLTIDTSSTGLVEA